MDDQRELGRERQSEVPLLDAVLVPHRSLSAVGFWLVMAAVSAASFAAGVVFLVIGAWPVLGFLGLDVALVYLAFRASYRGANTHESVRLTPDELTVRRMLPSGQSRVWTFQPYWVRLSLDDPPSHASQLTIASHGRSVVVGSFLAPGERVQFADALRVALARCRGVA